MLTQYLWWIIGGVLVIAALVAGLLWRRAKKSKTPPAVPPTQPPTPTPPMQ